MNEQRAAVIGHPIGHTMSPFLQQRLFELSDIPMAYQVLDVPDLEAGLPQLRELDCFNVTIPHKSGILPFLEEADEKAKACGSVNTVRVRGGKLYGATTDGEGCVQALRRHGLDLSGSVLLLGSGGAARALAFEVAARQEKVRLTIVCREGSYRKTQVLGYELASFIKKQGKSGYRIVIERYDELEADRETRYDLLLNATSVGMVPHAGESPVSAEVISRCGAVFDAVYNPEETQLLKLAKAAGVPAVGGLEMLVYQAAASHRFWYGSTFRDEDLSRLCEDARRELRKRFGTIVLCGFMGSGKTTVGKRLAKLLDRPYCDLDKYVEKKAGKTISKIFEEQGEAAFRELEAQAVEEAAGMGGAVIAAGGGTVLFPRNVEAFHAHGASILLLEVPLAALQERLKGDTRRPLLQRPDRREFIGELFEKRMPLYRAAADLVIDAAAPSSLVAERIAALGL